MVIQKGIRTPSPRIAEFADPHLERFRLVSPRRVIRRGLLLLLDADLPGSRVIDDFHSLGSIGNSIDQLLLNQFVQVLRIPAVLTGKQLNRLVQRCGIRRFYRRLLGFAQRADIIGRRVQRTAAAAGCIRRRSGGAGLAVASHQENGCCYGKTGLDFHNKKSRAITLPGVKATPPGGPGKNVNPGYLLVEGAAGAAGAAGVALVPLSGGGLLALSQPVTSPPKTMANSAIRMYVRFIVEVLLTKFRHITSEI